jgi:DNA-binding MarR family transcriptional regulator
MHERPISRRTQETAPYRPERGRYSLTRVDDETPDLITHMRDYATMSSAFRRALREQDIDHAMARLVLCFYGPQLLRPRNIAWLCNVSRTTASRWLDTAERLGLVDKYYDQITDRRATEARLTEKGVLLRAKVEELLRKEQPPQPRFGKAYGRRWYENEASA